ncbi:unnamed protein product [Brugia timori]|uniref:Uncharacterized protein n=1 Tax=Brugia timori TaxID=42155 RepID=A0A3P7ZM47_9BILA|nr:unnamed protein product [Brugia timori]
MSLFSHSSTDTPPQHCQLVSLDDPTSNHFIDADDQISYILTFEMKRLVRVVKSGKVCT